MATSFLSKSTVSSEKNPPIFMGEGRRGTGTVGSSGKAASRLDLTRGRELGISLLRCRPSFNPPVSILFSSCLSQCSESLNPDNLWLLLQRHL